MSIPSLAQTQHLLWKLITAPEGVAKGLEELPAAERQLAANLVRDRRPLSAVERWDIYANMYFYRIRDCLQEDFAAVAAVLGEAGFHNLITDYLLQHPPAHFSLRYVGRHLPDFVVEHESTQRLPYLADLARLEYAIADAFDAEDAPPLRADALAKVAPGDWPSLRLSVTPSLRLLRLQWPVVGVWQAAKDGDEPAALEAQSTAMRVWRRGLSVFHKTIEPREGEALTVLRDGGTFERLCEVVTGDGNEEMGAEAAFGMLRSWLADEVLVDLLVPSAIRSGA